MLGMGRLWGMKMTFDETNFSSLDASSLSAIRA
jgi:hypothetical protein